MGKLSQTQVILFLHKSSSSTDSDNCRCLGSVEIKINRVNTTRYFHLLSSYPCLKRLLEEKKPWVFYWLFEHFSVTKYENFFCCFLRAHRRSWQAERRACKTDYAWGILQQFVMVLHLLNSGQMALHFKILWS